MPISITLILLARSITTSHGLPGNFNLALETSLEFLQHLPILGISVDLNKEKKSKVKRPTTGWQQDL